MQEGLLADILTSLTRHAQTYQEGEHHASSAFERLLLDQENVLGTISCEDISFKNDPSFLEISQKYPESTALEILLSKPKIELASALKHSELIQSDGSKISPSIFPHLIENFIRKMKGLTFVREVAIHDYISIPIAELHCPPVPGCKSTYTFTTKKFKESKFTVSLFNVEIGGGPEIQISTTKSVDSTGKCLLIAKNCKIAIDVWTDKNGKPFRYLKILSMDSGLVTKELPIKMENHFCSNRFSLISKTLRKFNAKDDYYSNILPYSLTSGSSVKESVNIRRGLIIDASVALKEIKDCLDLKIGFKSKVETEFDYEFQLAGGYDYLGFYRGFKSSSYMWTWQQNGMADPQSKKK
jgi:hypothetical protein